MKQNASCATCRRAADCTASVPTSLTWWGTLGFMLIEGTRLCAGDRRSISILLALASEWPIGAPPPDLWPGTAVDRCILLQASVPNWIVNALGASHGPLHGCGSGWS